LLQGGLSQCHFAKEREPERLGKISSMSLSNDAPDPWWFAPLLYAGICLAVAAALLANLILTAV
jgi:hypothetical protein